MKKTFLSFIEKSSVTTGIVKNIPNGKYSGIVLKKSGTNLTSVEISNITDKIVVTVNGKQRINASFRNLNYINKMTEGYIPETSGTSFEFVAYIPINFEVNDYNPVQITVSSMFGGDTTNNFEIYGVLDYNAIDIGTTVNEFQKSINGRDIIELNGNLIYILPATESSVSNINITDSNNNVIINGTYDMVKKLTGIFANMVSSVNGILVNIETVEKLKVIIDTSTSVSITFVAFTIE